MTLADILGGTDTRDERPCNGQRVRLTIAAVNEHGARIARDACGILQLEEVYTETFLLCHAFIGGEVILSAKRCVKFTISKRV